MLSFLLKTFLKIGCKITDFFDNKISFSKLLMNIWRKIFLHCRTFLSLKYIN